MSIIENQMKLGRELFEINSDATRRMSEIFGEGVRQYFATNQEFGQRLSEVRDVTSFMDLQREYSETLYNGLTERMQTQGEVLRDAVEKGSEALRGAFSAGDSEEPAAPAAAEEAAAA